MAARSGIAGANIAASETGRREPRWETAPRALRPGGGPTPWRRSCGGCRYGRPVGASSLDPGLWWSGSPPRFDLADRADRTRAYGLVLREGGPDDIRSIIDGALLIDSWPELVVPAELRRAWQSIIDRYRHYVAEPS